MPVKVVGIGAGGHAKQIIEILRSDNRCEIFGLTEKNPELHGTNVLGVKVIGDDDLLPRLSDDGVTHFFVGCGGIGDNRHRRHLFELARKNGLSPVNAIHPSAVVSPSALIGEGVVVAANAVINAGAKVGSNVIINTGAIVEHDCVIGDHVHIATGVLLAGAVKIEDSAHIGAGAMIREGVNIADHVTVGMGAVVTKNVPRDSVVIETNRVIGRDEWEQMKKRK